MPLATNKGKKYSNKPSKPSDAGVITFFIAFDFGGFRNLKYFYINHWLIIQF